MTPMIDVVFQLIIFFIVTVRLEKDQINKSIELAQSPHGPAIEQKPPVVVEVDSRGRIFIGGRYYRYSEFKFIIRSTVARVGTSVPGFSRGDKDTAHMYIRRVMDVCTAQGLYKVQFAAMKQKAGSGG